MDHFAVARRDAATDPRTGLEHERFAPLPRKGGSDRQTNYAGANHQIFDFDPLDHHKAREIRRRFEYAENSRAQSMKLERT